MKDKDKEIILAKISRLKKHLEDYPFINLEYPDLFELTDNIHQAVAYQEVKEKDDVWFNFNKAELKDLAFFCDQIQSFKGEIATTKVAPKDFSKYLNAQDLKSLSTDFISLKSNSDAVFHDLIDKMSDYISALSSGTSFGNLWMALQSIAAKEFGMIDNNAIRKTESLEAVKEMKLDILEQHFFANYKLYQDEKKIKILDVKQLMTIMNDKFSSAYVMSVGDFSKDINLWVEYMKTDLSKLVAHPYSKAEIAVDLIAKDIIAQIGTRSADHPVFTVLAAAFNASILSLSKPTPTFLEKYVVKMMATLDKINAITITQDMLLTVNEPDFFSKRLKGSVTLSDVAINHVNKNAPSYICNQSNFKANLLSKLNEWKESLNNSLGVASQTVIELDGANFSATKFLTNISNNVSNLLPDIQKKLSTIPIKDISLRAHKDLTSFNTQWDLPWRNAVNSIDIDAFVKANENNLDLLAKLYSNLHGLLPSQDDVLSSIMNCISGKVNLALEQAIKNRNEMRSKFAEVNQKINHLQTEVSDIKNKVDVIEKKVDKIEKDVAQIKDDVKYIKKKIDEFEPNETDLEINTEVNVNDLIDVTTSTKVDVKLNTDKIKKIINKFLEQGNLEKKFLEIDESVTIARWTVLSASLRYGVSVEGSLKHKLVDSGIGLESTGEIKADAYAGLGIEAFSIGDFSLVEAVGTLHAEMIAQATARLTVTKETLIEGAMQMSMELGGYAKFEFIALSLNLYEVESDRLKILVLKSPIYAIGFQVNTWKYQGARKKSGSFSADWHPELKAMFKKALEYVGDPTTYAKMVGNGIVWVAESTAEYVSDGISAVTDGVGSVLSYVNPFD